MGKKSERIYELEQELANVKGTNSVLEAWRKGWIAQFDNKAGNLQSTMLALTQLWGMMGANHQTEAVIGLEKLIKEAKLGKAYNDLVRETNQTAASLRHQIFTLETAQRQLVFERDGAKKSREDQGYELANTKARVEELEEGLRAVISHSDSKERTALSRNHELYTRLARLVGDEF